MNHSKKRKEITALIDNIKMHSDRLTNNENIPILELSVILSKIDRLKEKTVIFKYILSEEQGKREYIDEEDTIEELIQKEEGSESEETKESDSAIDNTVEAQLESSNDDEAKAANPEKEEQKSTSTEETREAKVDSSGEKAAEETAKQENTEDSTEVDNSAEKAAPPHVSEASEALSKMPDLNEQYSKEEEDPSLSDQLKKQPIADLLTAIGLNERYLYANELFEGNIGEFKEVVKTLNEQSSLKEAQEYFNETLLPTYNWKPDNEMVQALYLLVERRYI